MGNTQTDAALAAKTVKDYLKLLDELAPLVCASLGLDPARTPLGCVLEGGTWAAGRASAQRLRAGRPPLSIASDGTVF